MSQICVTIGISVPSDILQAEQQSNNNNTGSCGGQCSNNKEGEENMNTQGSYSVPSSVMARSVGYEPTPAKQFTRILN